MRFDTFAMVDWSGGKDTGPTPRRDAIWMAVVRDGVAEEPRYLRNRNLAEQVLSDLIVAEEGRGRRLLIGFDFPFGYPAGFAQALTDAANPLGVWDWLLARIEDRPDNNNRFDLAGQINQALGQGRGPFWANALKREIDGLPRTKTGYENPFPDRRACEEVAKGAFTCWQLAGAGAVGSQVLMGMPLLARLRRKHSVTVWPFEPLTKQTAFVEIWPSLISDVVARLQKPDEIKDAAQVRIMAQALAQLSPETLSEMLTVEASEEGWIFGLGHEHTLAEAATRLQPPPLRNDCFALPVGVEWTPVETALDHLRQSLHPVVGQETVTLAQAAGRIASASVLALRANPPRPNSAVDGYGFAGGLSDDQSVTLPLVAARATAGMAPTHAVPKGHAVRILTGAVLPDGVDTVALQEDVTTDGHHVALRGPLRAGANARAAGEDVQTSQEILSAGRRITPADLALLAATGHAQLEVFRPLRVGVLSTGDELLPPGAIAEAGQIHDANRVMLLAVVARLGFTPVDLGIAPDDRETLRKRLDAAVGQVDVLLTSGGASAGDEDHMSALLRDAGAMQMWRIAVKPGRPLALGLWKNVPVFGLPGNPVAALVCTLVFARPALSLLAGAGWQTPQGFDLPAAFSKRKKAGRREYLRARVRNGQAEVFKSEGSGRISGLSWAEGLVELGDGAADIAPGDPVRFLPFGSFGL